VVMGGDGRTREAGGERWGLGEGQMRIRTSR
jgi:hypothetical protein